MWAAFQCKTALARYQLRFVSELGQSKAHRFSTFPEYFLANTVHFIRFEYFVNHCDLE